MNVPTITILSFSHFGKNFLDRLSASVRAEYNCAVSVKDAYVDLSEYYDPVRRQYNGDKVLKEVDFRHDSEALKTIGLFDIDLFIPILTFIFGQAQLNGRTSIASLFRLNNERYGLPANEELLLNRFTKEVIHELGHTFGLIHCHTPTCVMRSSTYVEDIDQKEERLCGNCRNKLGL